MDKGCKVEEINKFLKNGIGGVWEANIFSGFLSSMDKASIAIYSKQFQAVLFRYRVGVRREKSGIGGYRSRTQLAQKGE